MHPILWQWGSFIIPSWHAFFVLAALIAWLSLGVWAKQAWPEGGSKRIDNLFLVTYIMGYIGARGLSIVLESQEQSISESFLQLFQLGSMTLYGGMIVAAVAAIIYAKILKLSIRHLADLTMPSALLGVAVGRIGCFLNGDDFGAPVANQQNPMYLVIKFPNLNDDLFRYPVQIWESLLCLGLILLCWKNRGWLLSHPGRIGTLGIIGYACSRFLLEFFRGDDRGHFLVDFLSPAQSISIGIIVLWTFYIRSNPRRAFR